MKNFAVFKRLLKKLYMHLCYITRPRNRNTVYFASFRGQYSDSPRAISECLHLLAPEVDIIWLVSPKYAKYVPRYVKKVYKPMQALKAQAQAKVWVLNYTYRKKSGIYKGKDLYYIQTWHGDRGIKAIGYMTEISGEEGYDGIDMSECDLFVAASKYGVKKAQNGLRYNGEVIMEGMPRNDKLINLDLYRSDAAMIKKSLSIGSDIKILLYAPTYREGTINQMCAIDIPQTIESLESNGEKWVCLIRSHSLSKGIKVNRSGNCPFLDVSSYPDMADLLLISDLLITDYSSCAGDFILTKKPVVLVHFDRKEYQERGRNLWIDPEGVGYLVVKNQNELNRILSSLYTYDHKVIDENIMRYYDTYESGKASEIIAKKILSIIGN